MNRNHVIAITGLAFMLGAGSALAQDDEEFDGTITVIANAEVATPDVFMQDISLPANAVDNADESGNSDGGLQEATGALENRQTALDAAAETVNEVTADFAEAVQDNAENSSRADDARPDAPGEIPVPPAG